MNGQSAREGAVETATGPRGISVPLVVITGLLLGGSLGLLLFWLFFS
jgi:high-affinity Fe2+/Pb2+ permease